MRLFLLLAVATLPFASIATRGQELGPVIDPGEVGRSSVISNIPSNQIRGRSQKAPPRQPTIDQVAACANKERLLAQHGAGHPGIRKLYRLCRDVGL